ncbi:THAP domain-containing protein 5-like isoform X2 [Thunnus maccoyii]|uniref:THAP domain-containing protein 5-like isoform X2 n=2 Tax=Thunnus TaxID=8234 RepID=UPI001C4C919A|nr:THAP domain-containing protein 5-like isoform X2 [Thunnus maccoyii]
MSCSAFGCTKRPCKESNLQFFRFPLSDHARLKRWIINVRRKNWTPSSSSRLCCNHFEEDQFFIDKKGKRRLKDTAVPTIFNFPPYLLKKKETTKATRIKSVERFLPSAADHEDPPEGGRKTRMDPCIKVPESFLYAAALLLFSTGSVRPSSSSSRMTMGEDHLSTKAQRTVTRTRTVGTCALTYSQR